MSKVLVPSVDSEGKSVMCLSCSFWCLSKIVYSSWLVDITLQSLPPLLHDLLPVCICVQISLSLNIPVTGLGPTLIWYDLILTSLNLPRSYFQIRSIHKYRGLGLKHIFLVDTTQLTTLGMTWWKYGVKVISEKGKTAGDEKVFWGENQFIFLTWLCEIERKKWCQFLALCAYKWEKTAYYLANAQ